MPVDLEIVSPEKLLLSRPVDMVVIPAAEGEMGVLPEHSPMIVLLRGGTIRLYENGQVTERLFVSGGFAEVTPRRVTVLANEATPVEQVSRAEGERRMAAAEAEYAAADKMDVPALDAAMDRIQAARAMVEAAQAA
ncbi:MAG: ATP synthase F1 subunit epsilon [Acetobacteraceae bacterium SCN 69-10]|nr:ATP synthase F1 subunit epsilon [Rhodospirillales bacterium]ODU62338.1 MAG: ATP synthase F1 subunit epsilon [Acetobacteraceae bacterium SCN 69-10]OJY73191.1 MAG: ATP synthase F1 subunit epsilon [Rhodospirillales bacterium 70-18]